MHKNLYKYFKNVCEPNKRCHKSNSLSCHLFVLMVLWFAIRFASVIGAYQVMHKLQTNPNFLYNSIRLDFYSRLHLRCIYNSFFFFYLIELSKVECTTGKNAHRKEEKTTKHFSQKEF